MTIRLLVNMGCEVQKVENNIRSSLCTRIRLVVRVCSSDFTPFVHLLAVICSLKTM